jgi:hypothetical protein
VTVILNLKDTPLRARGCGNCQGSSSDNKIRTDPAAAGAAPQPAPAA